MELRQLEYFVAVAEEANFTRAATRLRIALPALSAQIRLFEQEFGVELLDRSGCTVQLTDAGAVVLPHARAALDAVSGARLAVDGLIRLMRGNVVIGTELGCGLLELPDLLAAFHRDHPAIRIDLAEANPDQLVDGLLAGELDLAFIGFARATPAGVDLQVVVDERIVAAVSKDNVLAGQNKVTVEALRTLALISLPTGTGLRAALDEAFGTARAKPRVAFEARRLNILAQLAARGLGVAVLPESTACAWSEKLHTITVTRPEMRARLALAWRAKGPISPAGRTLISEARKLLPDLSHASSTV
jgi:DNA-binding transcriptional LysR family regulator